MCLHRKAIQGAAPPSADTRWSPTVWPAAFVLPTSYAFESQGTQARQLCRLHR
jgi:hypothetical protein